MVRKFSFALGLAGSFSLVAGLVIACGTEDDSKFKDGEQDANSPFNVDGSFDPDASKSQDDLYKNDPLPKYCGPAQGNPPPPIGGTEQCPDDKNKPGCFCTTVGAKAACWTGLRKHRNIGICHDGETTCVAKNETENVWGPCTGQQLPDPNATKGKEACMCFSAGQWKIANLSPCIRKWSTDGGATYSYYAMSTIPKAGGGYECPYQVTPPTPEIPPPYAAPSQVWSTDTLNVDCEGHFRLCFRIRAGDFKNPQASDCILGEVCAESDYVKKNVEQAWPDLPGWVGADNACAKKWETTDQNISPGYGEMIVKGQSILCDNIDDGKGGDLVFNRVEYCPRICRDAANKDLPACKACQTSGQGQF